ncbi:hypothetical protein HA402_012821 [Bradysia odoriphaga]|nr:hypothetical protein HA402_012821 [Bradysia odoriphaga]
MKKTEKLLVLGFLTHYYLALVAGTTDNSNVSENQNLGNVSDYNKEVAENHLSAQIFALMEHFHQADPIGLPGAPVPDPFAVPDVKKSVGIGTLTLQNTLAYGMSKFRLKYIKTDLNKLTVKAGIQLDQMNVRGNYTLSSLFSKTHGPFTIVLRNVFVKGNASLGVERDGKIRTKDIQMDISFGNMAVDFQNLGFFAGIFQSIINSAPTLVFDAIKPLLLSEAYVQISQEIDSSIEMVSGDHRFPNSISPLDMAIADARKKVRALGYDPYKVKDYNHTVGLFEMKMTNTWITGVSSFYRVGEITVGVNNLTISIGMQVGTQKVLGASQWEVSFGGGMITRSGNIQFTIDHIKATFEISQSLDMRKRPEIFDLQLELGNIQVSDHAISDGWSRSFMQTILGSL